MAEFGNKGFWDNLGQYVYGYKDSETGEWLYFGKGNGNRGSTHIKTKGYNIDDLYIIACNLEKFEGKQDWQSFELESFLISLYNPSGNSVSGHYKECFVMSRFSTLFKNYTDSQYDSFAELPQWYLENYANLKGKIGTLVIKSETIQLFGQTRNSMAMNFYVNPVTDEVTQIDISIWNGATIDVQAQGAELVRILADMGYEAYPVGKKEKHKTFRIDETDIQKVVDIFVEFMS